MVGIQGIGGIPEPAPERPANARDRKDADNPAGAPAQDGVVISSEAQAAAAALAKAVQAANLGADIRAERVAAAQQALERGDYRRPDIVQIVADRIEKYL
jgi:hypothetical protein